MRDYLLVDAALNALLLSKVFGITLPSSDNKQEEIISEGQDDIIVTERSQEDLQSVPQENNMSNETARKKFNAIRITR